MTFQVVYPKDLEYIQKNENAIIVDIRCRGDYRMDHFPGAVNIPMDEVKDHEKMFSKNKYYILYCEHGGSSMQYARDLGRKGYKMASVIGGYEAIKKYRKNYFKNSGNM